MCKLYLLTGIQGYFVWMEEVTSALHSVLRSGALVSTSHLLFPVFPLISSLPRVMRFILIGTNYLVLRDIMTRW